MHDMRGEERDAKACVNIFRLVIRRVEPLEGASFGIRNLRNQTGLVLNDLLLFAADMANSQSLEFSKNLLSVIAVELRRGIFACVFQQEQLAAGMHHSKLCDIVNNRINDNPSIIYSVVRRDLLAGVLHAGKGGKLHLPLSPSPTARRGHVVHEDHC